MRGVGILAGLWGYLSGWSGWKGRGGFELELLLFVRINGRMGIQLVGCIVR